MRRAEGAGGWLRPALLAVGMVTLARLVLLAFNRTDLFVDESQYWLWGQNPDFGYYSKPPLIGWLIGAVTGLAGSDAPFWVRAPGALLHGATALILAASAARLAGARAAFWVAFSYVTLPFTAVGSLIISTDTVLAPAYAAAIWFWLRLTGDGALRWALATGAAVGLACMAKYAGVYFLLGAGLAALAASEARVGWRNAGLILLAFGAVIAPNVIWNLTHDLQTVSHTMDNVGWVRPGAAPRALNPGGLVTFFLSQFGVFGPVLFAALLAAILPVWRAAGQGRGLLCMTLPPLIVVCFQALMKDAYANWALTAYFPGLLIVVPFLTARLYRLLPVSVALNGALCLALPVLTVTAPWPERGGMPLMKRYLGRTDLSREIIALAQAQGATRVMAESRDILADLFYTGRDAGLGFYAQPPAGKPRNYYEELFALPQGGGAVLAVLSSAPVCNGTPLTPLAQLHTKGLAYDSHPVAAYLMPEGCL